ncbi:MAG: RNA 2',3'-cyclic phosphodiesterase [Betaproteobacteria bacterium]
MRLFTAVDLSDEARTAIAGVQARLRRALDRGRSSLRWVRPEHMHLTLVFLGELPEAQVPALIENMSAAVDIAPFTAVLGGLGTFPPERAPRVLWLGLEAGVREAIELERLVRARVAQADLPVDARPFHPHLTLARWRESRPSDRRLPDADARAVARIDVREVTLYESRLGSNGPSYNVLARASLRAQ